VIRVSPLAHSAIVHIPLVQHIKGALSRFSKKKQDLSLSQKDFFSFTFAFAFVIITFVTTLVFTYVIIRCLI